MKDTNDCEVMNELFDSGEEYMNAQIYVKSDNDNTSVIVSNEYGDIYFQDVLNVPEITGIHRGVSFVKHHLDVYRTEIYPDKLKIEEVMKDAYINWCKVKAVKGETPNEKAKTLCSTNLIIHNRWNLKGTKYER